MRTIMHQVGYLKPTTAEALGERPGWQPTVRFNAEPEETEPTEPQNPGPTSEDSASEEMSYSPRPPGSASDVWTLLDDPPAEEPVWADADAVNDADFQGTWGVFRPH